MKRESCAAAAKKTAAGYTLAAMIKKTETLYEELRGRSGQA